MQKKYYSPDTKVTLIKSTSMILSGSGSGSGIELKDKETATMW